jgi:hypothetical protein
MKAILRAAALRVPPIRRLYAYAMQQAQENHEHAVALATAVNERSAAEQRLAAKSNELAAAAEDRDAQELQLYVLRSDHQRAAVRNRELAASVQAAEARADAAAAADRTVVTSQELARLYAGLAGRMTLLASEIARLSNSPTAGGNGTTLYLDLLERALAGVLGADIAMEQQTAGDDAEARMTCLARMRNLRELTERVIQEDIPGDMLEAGIRHGGASILMRGILAAHKITDRTIWVAGSIAGPTDLTPDPTDAGDQQATCDARQVSSAEVRAHFQRYGLLDQQVQFLTAAMVDILPAPFAQVAILRIDGDRYASTIQTLGTLYDKVSPGGYVIVDGHKLSGCRQAVDDFRDRHGIRDELVDFDGAAVFWRKIVMVEPRGVEPLTS